MQTFVRQPKQQSRSFGLDAYDDGGERQLDSQF
jgi:hypothetical protein